MFQTSVKIITFQGVSEVLKMQGDEIEDEGAYRSDALSKAEEYVTESEY